MLTLYNTLTRTKESFIPRHNDEVRMYTCGPTVYNFLHIGNIRTYIFEDILKRTLVANGYSVNHVMNITDVGHLTNDSDFGEDKMEKGALREGKTAWEIAEYYTKIFQEDFRALNILPPNVSCKATDNIPEQIAMVQTLIEKGYTYETSDGIYFDTTKVADYGKLANLSKQQLKAGARVEMGEKKNPHDFALWKFSPANEQRQMEWDAFGRKGFPGWHIECSAMSIKYLGEQFDIHCGGIDHVPLHHTNEIAQSEAVTGKIPWVKYWLHGEFLTITDDAGTDKKMAKSGDNFITLRTLIEHGISPLAYRYWLLQTHYRKQLTFSWEALRGAEQGLERLYRAIQTDETGKADAACVSQFMERANDDLHIPEALALVWDMLKSDLPLGTKRATAIACDQILGLGIAEKNFDVLELPSDVKKLLDEREIARQDHDWTKSDQLRDTIAERGFMVEDTKDGQTVKKMIY